MYKDHETPRFWKTYGDGLRKYLAKRVGDKSLIDDILHDVYLKVYLHCKRYDFCCEKAGVKNLRSWIFQVCHNIMVDHLKNKAKYTFTGNNVIELVELPFWDDEPNPITAQQILKRLPPKYAEAVYLDVVLKLNQAKIATQLGLGISAAKSRIQRGKRMLRELYCQQADS